MCCPRDALRNLAQRKPDSPGSRVSKWGEAVERVRLRRCEEPAGVRISRRLRARRLRPLGQRVAITCLQDSTPGRPFSLRADELRVCAKMHLPQHQGQLHVDEVRSERR